MRHKKNFNHLSRKSAHRKAMLRNMAISLIEHKRIKTTIAKARALRTFVEPVINRSKEDTTHSRRMVFKRLQNKDAVNTLFREIAQKVSEREGGYTRILKIGNRLGDNAEMCYIELVDYNETYQPEKAGKTKRKRTRRAGSGSSSKAETTQEQKEEHVEENSEEKNEAEEIKNETVNEESSENVSENEDSKEEEKKDE